MTTALLIPVDGDLEHVDTTDEQIAERIGANWFELVTNRDGGYSIAVDDEGLLIGRPPNLRATALARSFGRAFSTPLVGDVLVLGVDPGGETVDVPADIALMFAEVP